MATNTQYKSRKGQILPQTCISSLHRFVHVIRIVLHFGPIWKGVKEAMASCIEDVTNSIKCTRVLT